jgi:hypothetical protein
MTNGIEQWPAFGCRWQFWEAWLRAVQSNGFNSSSSDQKGRRKKGRSDPRCISAVLAALDRYLAALPAMSLIPFAPFAKAMASRRERGPPGHLLKSSFVFRAIHTIVGAYWITLFNFKAR